MKDYSNLEDLDTEDVSTTVNKIKVNTQKKFYKQGETKKAPKPLIGDSESEEDNMEEEGAEEDEFEDYSDLDLDTESENELPNEAGSSKGIPRTKYERYLAGERTLAGLLGMQIRPLSPHPHHTLPRLLLILSLQPKF